MGTGRSVNRLNGLKVSRASAAGLYADGNGIYLQVAPSGAKSWILRFRHAGRRRDMGLGSLATVSLSEARQKATDARKDLDAGRDPIDARNAAAAAQEAKAARGMTFKVAALDCIKDRKDGWRNAKHADQWESTLTTYAFPTLGNVPVAAVDSAMVLKVLKPIWSAKPETASRVRGRIETVLDWAKAHKLREGENPARWRGMLDQVLPPRGKVRVVAHHPALPIGDVGAFMTKLREQNGTAARALELLILTAARTSETIRATWDEFDLSAKVWTIPKERTKAGRAHRVPLSAAALNVLKSMGEPVKGVFVFPGGKRGQPLSTNALLALLKRMGRADITSHGFRSTFRDWAAAQTNFPREVAEHALAHNVGGKVERAYQRDDLLAKRVKLMDAWAGFCAHASSQASIVSISRATRA